MTGHLRFFLGRAADAEEAFDRAVQEAGRAGDANLERDAYAWWAAAKYHGPAPVSEGRAFIDALPRSAFESAKVAAFMAEVTAGLDAMEERFEEARAQIARAKSVADDFGLELRSAAISQYSGAVEDLAGDLTAAEREYRRGYELLGGLGETAFRATTGCHLAAVLVARGRDADAERIIDEIAHLAQTDDVDVKARTRQVRALLLVQKGCHDEALELAREAVALFGATDYLDANGHMLLTLARVLRAMACTNEAREALEAALALFERKGNLTMAQRVRVLLDD